MKKEVLKREEESTNSTTLKNKFVEFVHKILYCNSSVTNFIFYTFNSNKVPFLKEMNNVRFILSNLNVLIFNGFNGNE